MSNIEWTDTTWNPVVGCTPVSPGCLNCYAATMARRLEAMGKQEYQLRVEAADLHAAIRDEQRKGKCYSQASSDAKPFSLHIAEVRGGRAVFTGDVRTVPDRLTDPLRWRKPRMAFVNSMSDLFHEAVPFEFIDRVFAVMASCPHHTFQVLTKRPERMAEYLRDRGTVGGQWFVQTRHLDLLGVDTLPADYKWPGLPIPNVWLGTSMENQATADERIPHLLECPAAVRFLSCEPLLEAVDIRDFWTDAAGPNLWVIVAGESGSSARPCDVAWIRSIVEQCRGASVPCFVKQLGAVPVNGAFLQNPMTGRIDSPVGGYGSRFVDRKGGDPSERGRKRMEAKADALRLWERKLKLAQTKVKKYRRAVAAMERRAAKRAEAKA